MHGKERLLLIQRVCGVSECHSRTDILWEHPALAFEIQASSNGSVWTSVKSVTGNHELHTRVSLPTELKPYSQFRYRLSLISSHILTDWN